jgi:hypothetical protein
MEGLKVRVADAICVDATFLAEVVDESWMFQSGELLFVLDV